MTGPAYRSPRLTLTARQMEVVRAAALGLSGQQIAAKLFITLDTVKTHKKRIAATLGVPNRVGGIVHECHRRGWL